MSYFTHCVHCQSDAGSSRMKVKRVLIDDILDVPLTEDGVLLQPSWFHSYDVVSGSVYCEVCDDQHPLSDQEIVFPWTLEAGDLVSWTNPEIGTLETLELIEVRFIRPGHPTQGAVEVRTDDLFMVIPASELSEVL